MDYFKDLAGKIRRLYRENKSEWLRLAEEGFEQEMNTRGSISFMPESKLDLPGMTARLTCLYDTVLKSSSPIIKYQDCLDTECMDPSKSVAYFVMLAAVDSLTQADVVQIEAWYDEVAEHFRIDIARSKETVPFPITPKTKKRKATKSEMKVRECEVKAFVLDYVKETSEYPTVRDIEGGTEYTGRQIRETKFFKDHKGSLLERGVKKTGKSIVGVDDI